jgi:hypothetical protein
MFFVEFLEKTKSYTQKMLNMPDVNAEIVKKL